MQTSGAKKTLVGVVLLLLVSVAYLARFARISHLEPIDCLYTVEGHAGYDNLRGGHWRYTFTLTVSNQSWAMKANPIEATGIASLAEERQVFDGANLVALRYYDTNKIDRSLVSRLPSGSLKFHDGYERIDDVAMAQEMPMAAPMIWVAYAAQFYLPPGTNGLLRPFWHPERSVRIKAFVPAEWRLLSSESELPESIDFFYDATGWDKVLQGRQTQSPSTNRPEKPIPVAAYQSFGRTNLGGRLFPLACAFTGFAPEREHKTGERLAMYKIEVTNVTVRSTVEHRLFDTVFRGAAVVEDYRGHRELPLDYEITNSAPPGLSDHRRLAAARQAWQLELARKRKEVLSKDWTIRAGGRRFGLGVFRPADGRGGRRYAIVLGNVQCSLGDDRARPKARLGRFVWVPALVLFVAAGLVIGIIRKRSMRSSQRSHGVSD